MFYTLSSNKVNSFDISELIYTIYKMLLDENSNEIRINELNGLFQIVFNEISSAFTYEQFTCILDGSFNSTSTNIPNFRNSKITFENFLKNFKVFLYYIVYSEKYLLIFEILDFEEKKKILTAELIVSLNKILRNLDENNIYISFTKIFLEQIDSNQVFISKSDFLCLLIKSLYI